MQQGSGRRAGKERDLGGGGLRPAGRAQCIVRLPQVTPFSLPAILSKRNFYFHLIWKHSFNGPRSGGRKCSPVDQSSKGKGSETTLSLTVSWTPASEKRAPSGEGRPCACHRGRGLEKGHGGHSAARASPRQLWALDGPDSFSPVRRERRGGMALNASCTYGLMLLRAGSGGAGRVQPEKGPRCPGGTES